MDRRARWAIALLTAIAVLTLAALQNGRASGAAAEASAAKGVAIDGFVFKPATQRVKRGGKVAFTNSSSVAHTATGASFDTKRIPPGKTALVRFNQRGTFPYHCKIHPPMKGKIVVE